MLHEYLVSYGSYQYVREAHVAGNSKPWVQATETFLALHLVRGQKELRTNKSQKTKQSIKNKLDRH
jgi:hypothetical protein